MSYIQSFLSRYLPHFYLQEIQTNKNNDAYFDFTSNTNIFCFTFDLLLFAHKGSPSNWTHLHKIIAQQMLIPYECLQNYQQKPLESDGITIRMMKSEIKQVHLQMLQLLLRFIVCYFESTHAQQINNTIQKNINDIGYIYPLLKTEISFKYNNINLSSFIEKYITQITAQTVTPTFIEVLQRIKEECAFMGSIEKVINRIVQGYKVQQVQSKKVDISSNDSELDYCNQKDNTHSFHDEDLRRKKRKIFKELIKSKSEMDNRTPTKQNIVIARHTPRTEKTEENKRSSEGKSPLKKTPIFKKIKKTAKKPMERTIYYGQTKRFVPKKSSSNSQIFIESFLSTSTLMTQSMSFNFFESNSRKTEKKLNKSEMVQSEANIFCIPQTPRPHMEKKNNIVKKAYSMDLMKSSVGLFKN